MPMPGCDPSQQRRLVSSGPRPAGVARVLLIALARFAPASAESPDDAARIRWTERYGASAGDGQDLSDVPMAFTDLEPSHFDATIRSPTHTKAAMVLFHHGKDVSIRGEFDKISFGLSDKAVQSYAVDCGRSPGFCRRLNAQSPSVFMYPPRGVGPTKVLRAAVDAEGSLRQRAILHDMAAVFAGVVAYSMLDAEKVDAFLSSALKPFKVVLWSADSSPTLIFQSLSTHPMLALYVDFGVIAGDDAGRSIAAELGIQGSPPSLVWMHGEDYATLRYFPGDVAEPTQVLEWALQTLQVTATATGCDPGFPELDGQGDLFGQPIELTAMSATLDVVVTVTLPRAATFRQAKRAIAKRLGNDDVLRAGELAVFDGSEVLIAREQDKVGDVREVILLGVEFVSYEKLDYGTNGCPTGQEIISAEECEQAIKSLGIPASPKWVSNFDGLPRHCSVREMTDKGSKERMHFNSASSGRGRSDLAPVCKAGKARGSGDATSATALFKSWAAKRRQDGEAAAEVALPGAGGQERRASGAREAEGGLVELTAANVGAIVHSNARVLVFLLQGALSEAESTMLSALAARIRPQVKERGTRLDWAWLNTQKEHLLLDLFSPPTLPSAVMLESTGSVLGYALLKHEAAAKDPQSVLPASEVALSRLVMSTLDGDAQFQRLSKEKFLSAFKAGSAAASPDDAPERRKARQSTVIVKQPIPEGAQVRLTVQHEVTVAEVKHAVAQRTGNKDIVENGVLAVWRGEAVGFVALAEDETVQNQDVKELVLLGAHLFLYARGAKGANGCKPGMEITSVGECETAIVSMGLGAAPKWISAYDGLPRFCSVREKPSKSTGAERMHYNSASSGQGRSDLTPICKRDDEAPPDARKAIENAAREAEAKEMEDDALIPQLTRTTRESLLGMRGFKVVYLCDGPIDEDDELMLKSLEDLFDRARDADDPPLAWMWLNVKEERRLKVQFDPPALPSAVVLRSTKGKYQYAVAEHQEFDDEPLPLDQEALQHFIATVLGGDATFFPISAAKLNSGWSDKAMLG